MEILAPLIPITLFVVVGAVLVLRPLSKRFGELLEAMALEKKRGHDSGDSARLREVVSSLENRLALLEERQNFTESLLSSGNHRTPISLGAEPRVREP